MQISIAGWNKTRYIISVTAFLFLLIVGFGLFLLYESHQMPLKHAQKIVSFPLYYPVLPSAYKLDKSSVKTESQIVFYSISDGDKKISVSEQPIPTSPPDFEKIKKSNPSFKKLDSLAGQAIVGTYLDKPVAFLLTNTTLININASKDTPEDIVRGIAASMRSL